MLGDTQRRCPAPAPVAVAGEWVSVFPAPMLQSLQEARLDCWISLLRCPYTGDNYQTKLIPVWEASDLLFPSHYQRFSISTFSFVDLVAKQALKGPVWCYLLYSLAGLETLPPTQMFPHGTTFQLMWPCNIGFWYSLRAIKGCLWHVWHGSTRVWYLSASGMSVFFINFLLILWLLPGGDKECLKT